MDERRGFPGKSDRGGFGGRGANVSERNVWYQVRHRVAKLDGEEDAEDVEDNSVVIS